MWIVEISDLFPPNPWDEGLEKMKNRAPKRPVKKNSCFLATSQVEIKYVSESSENIWKPLHGRYFVSDWVEQNVVLRFGGLRQYSQGRIVLKYLYWSWGFFNRGFRGILSVMRVRIRSLKTVWLISLNL